MAISSLNRMSSFFRIDKKKELARVQDYIGRMRIKTPSEEQLIRNLSGGNQQKIIIAREVSSNPDLLIAVQPTRGLDVGAEEFVHQALYDQRNSGKAVLLISFELDEILAVSDLIMVLHK